MFVVALACAVYAIRAQLKRAVIAASIYHAHIFTAPSPVAGESRWDRLRDSAQFYYDFSEIPLARERRLKLLDPILRPIVKEINRHQAAGDDTHYSMHIYREIRWRLNFTPDTATTRARISDLHQTKHFPRWPGYCLRRNRQGATHFILNSKMLCVHLSSAGRILKPGAGGNGFPGC
jgi:hypothetical protein